MPYWYTLGDVVFGSETIDGNLVATAAFNLADGKVGDDTGDDGFIIEPAGPGLPRPVPTSIPTLNQWALLGLPALLALIGMGRIKRRQQT